jgi:hypothetical protein
LAELADGAALADAPALAFGIVVADCIEDGALSVLRGGVFSAGVDAVVSDVVACGAEAPVPDSPSP